MPRRFRILGLGLAAIGLVFLAAGVYAFARVQAGYDSLQAFSTAQNVTLSYDEDGRLLDRGTPEGAEAILTMLTDEWGYDVVGSDLNPADPLVNTPTEYMFQMATIGYHVMNGTQTVVLDEAVEYDGETFAPGAYEFAVDGRYWTEFDRQHPIEGPAREQAWSGTVHGLFGELGVGTVTGSTLQMGLGLAGLLAGIGLTLVLAGFGMRWAAAGLRDQEVVIPDYPADLVKRVDV